MQHLTGDASECSLIAAKPALPACVHRSHAAMDEPHRGFLKMASVGRDPLRVPQFLDFQQRTPVDELLAKTNEGIRSQSATGAPSRHLRGVVQTVHLCVSTLQHHVASAGAFVLAVRQHPPFKQPHVAKIVHAQRKTRV